MKNLSTSSFTETDETGMNTPKPFEFHSYFYYLRLWIKNRAHFRHYNLVKFYFISNVLDLLVRYRYVDHLDKVPFSFISKKMHNQYAIPEFMSKVTYDESIGIIREMEWMRLIDFDLDNQESLILTPTGLQMYESQYFHSIYSSLLEAHSSRKLSRNTLILAVVSVIIAIISLIL